MVLDDVDVVESSARPLTITSKQRWQSTRLPTTPGPPSLRTWHSETPLQSQAPVSSAIKRTQSAVKLRSAFRVPVARRPAYCRNPPMTVYKFRRTTTSFQLDGSCWESGCAGTIAKWGRILTGLLRELQERRLNFSRTQRVRIIRAIRARLLYIYMRTDQWVVVILSTM